MSESQRLQVLTVVMTYPHPSSRYQELVCTAGITKNGDWVRLYPIDYRYRPREQQFRKYQWIELDLDSTGVGNDTRKESRRPHLDSIRLIGQPLSPSNGWRQRCEIIDRLPHFTRNQLEAAYQVDKTSLGIVRPKKILDLEIREATKEWKPEWKPEWKNLYSQMTLFGPTQKPLRKIPYSFHYVFECEDSDRPHVAMCEDWELGVLFLNEAERLGSDELAAEKVRSKFLDQMCRSDRDTRFFMGTYFPYNTWLVLGVFWPPKQTQGQLF